MSKSIDYKAKYQALMAKYMASVEQAHQMGYEKGYNEGTQDSQAQQMADMQAQQAAMMGQGGEVDENGNPIDPGMDQQDPSQDPSGMDPMMQQADDAQMQQGTSEVDSKLNELESLVAKSEGKKLDSKEIKELLKSLNTAFNKVKESSKSTGLRKSLTPFKKMKKMHKQVKAKSTSFQANVKEAGKKALSDQASIVDNIMKSWDAQEAEVTGDISKVLGAEGHTK